MAFIVDYRPETFDDLIMDEGQKESLRNLAGGDVHCFLFHGERGCGKTTTAGIVAKELGVNPETALWPVNCADKTGVADARNLIEQLSFLPIGSPCKVFILDECHMLSNSAQSSLLDALEKPPDWAYFILCTTHPQKVLPTVRSRAQSFRFGPTTRKNIAKLLDKVIEAEGLDVDPKVIRAIISNAGGIPREALGLLERVQYIDDVEAAILAASEGIESKEVLDLLKLICSAKTPFGSRESHWRDAKAILKSIDTDPEQVRRAILSYLEKVIMDIEEPFHWFRIGQCFRDDYFSDGRFGLLDSVYMASQVGVEPSGNIPDDDIPF